MTENIATYFKAYIVNKVWVLAQQDFAKGTKDVDGNSYFYCIDKKSEKLKKYAAKNVFQIAFMLRH